MVFLGDHQPSPIASGANASHDVPITIVAKDPAVLERVTSWGWADGLRPKRRLAGVADERVPGQVLHRVRAEVCGILIG